MLASMATGVVSGVVADLLQKSPGLNPDQVKARLMKTAWNSLPSYSSTTDPTTGITYTDQYDVFTVGAGYVDLEAALKSTDVANKNAMSPYATYDSKSGNVYLNDYSSSVWNTSSTWSNAAVWGSSQFVAGASSSTLSSSSTVSGSNILWGSSTAVWGSNILWGSNTVWGSNILWGSDAMYANNILWGSNVSGGEK